MPSSPVSGPSSPPSIAAPSTRTSRRFSSSKAPTPEPGYRTASSAPTSPASRLSTPSSASV
jgi:hypothetical protein